MADAYLGTRTQLSFGEESTAGSKASTSVTQFGLVNSADLPDEEIDWLTFWNIGSGRDFAQAVEGKHTLASSLPVTLQNGVPLFYALGKETCVGTDVASGGGSTLDGATVVGDTSFDVADASNYAADDYIQVDVTSNAEVRKITGVSSNTITVDKAFRLAHSTGVACNEVTAPYVHTLSKGNSLKSFTLEAAQLADTNFVRFFDGVYIDTLDIGGTEETAIEATFGFKAMKTEASGSSASTVTIGTEVPYMFDEGAVTLHGGTIARVTNFKLNMNNDIKEGRYIDSSSGRYPKEMIIGRRKVEFTVTAVADSTDWWDLLKTPGSATTFSAKYTRGTDDYIDFQTTATRLKSAPHKFPEENAMTVDLSYVAKTLTIEVKDSTPYYWAV